MFKVEEFSEIIRSLRNLPSDKALAELIKSSNEMGIFVKYTHFMKNKEKIIDRVILSNFKNSHAVVDGYIFDFLTGNLLAHPMPALNKNKLSRSRINELNDDQNVKIYPVFDGTILNLYYYGDKLQMGTSHGIDVSNHTLFTTSTYYDAFIHAVKKTGFDLSKLDKSKSHTVLFRSELFHPLVRIDSQNMVELIASFDLKTYEMEMIQKPLKKSLKEALKTHDIENESFDKKPNNMAQYFGFIIRATEHILVESNLSRTLRQIYYNLPKHITFKNSFERQLYVLLRAVFNRVYLDKFELLFPQHSKEIAVYSSLMDKVVKTIVLNNRSIKEQKKKDSSKEETLVCDLVELLLVENIRRQTTCGTNTISITRDMVMDIRNLDIVFDLLRN